jgi:hypothetical protein
VDHFIWRPLEVGVAPLTHLLPFLKDMSHSLGPILVGGLYMWLDHFIILCIID